MQILDAGHIDQRPGNDIDLAARERCGRADDVRPVIADQSKVVTRRAADLDVRAGRIDQRIGVYGDRRRAEIAEGRTGINGVDVGGTDADLRRLECRRCTGCALGDRFTIGVRSDHQPPGLIGGRRARERDRAGEQRDRAIARHAGGGRDQACVGHAA